VKVMSGAGERKRLMKLKKRMSQKRPKFVQFESWRFVRVKDHWRQPKGVDNHMRQNKRGWPKSINVGYGSPKAVRNLHPSGMEEVAVYNVGDLAIIDPEMQVARIGGSVGLKKRTNILREAETRGIRILNPGKAREVFQKELEEAEAEAPEDEAPEEAQEEPEAAPEDEAEDEADKGEEDDQQ